VRRYHHQYSCSFSFETCERKSRTTKKVKKRKIEAETGGVVRRRSDTDCRQARLPLVYL